MTDILLQSTAAAAGLPAALGDLDVLIDRQIRSFLEGDSDGSELLRGLYGDAIDEPIPGRLMALLKR
jgi:hypothetical protein